jgi:hypothetical protein
MFEIPKLQISFLFLFSCGGIYFLFLTRIKLAVLETFFDFEEPYHFNPFMEVK